MYEYGMCHAVFRRIPGKREVLSTSHQGPAHTSDIYRIFFGKKPQTFKKAAIFVPRDF
jgi:hypothetical protein